METAERNRRDASAALLKWLALCSMLIDHMGMVLLPALMRYGRANALPLGLAALKIIYRIMRAVGRSAFPLYLFLLLEGFFHTRSRLKYLGRLGIFALLSEIPFNLAVRSDLWDPSHQNVFFTLFIGFLALVILETLRRDPGPLALRVCGMIGTALLLPLAARLLHTDYGAAGVGALELAYCVRGLWERRGGERGPRTLAAEFCGMLCPLVLLSHIEICALAALPAVCRYRGRKGRQPNRWFFYGFYPAHLLLLSLLRILILRGV